MKEDKEWISEWNELHIKFTKLGPEIRNNKMADYCETTILKAKETYYNEGDIIMSDQRYDKFENYLRILRPESEILEKVGK